MLGKGIDELLVGDAAEFSKTITEADVVLFAGVTGDLNPAHMDQVWAEGTRFGGRIAHGMLSAGLISAVLGMQLPGPGTIYLSQELRFLAPVRIGDTVTARVEVEEVIKGKNRVRLRTTCRNQEGTQVVDGVAWVMPPKRQGV
ncbi:MAG: MaoC family dehydratase [Thermodesulfobacteriota bacterium]